MPYMLNPGTETEAESCNCVQVISVLFQDKATPMVGYYSHKIGTRHFEHQIERLRIGYPTPDESNASGLSSCLTRTVLDDSRHDYIDTL